MKFNFKDIDGIESGVIRFMFKWFIPGQGYGNFNLDQLPNADKKLFVRETHSSSTYGAGDLVLVVLYQGGTFSPVPNHSLVVSRNHERSDCLGGRAGDPSPNPKDIDDDGDGYTENEGDCKDNNANIHPGAIEICGDGIDQDCNGKDLACESTPPVDENCVPAYISGNTLNLGNIYAGFQVPYGKTGTIVAVSEKTGWQYEDGISVSISGGDGSVNLSKLMFSSGTTRFNLIMRVDGVDYWFISDLLCESAITMLQHQTNSPEAPWADNDVVMSLKNVSEPFMSFEVGYRG
jgi:hypothetical protein